MGKWGWILMVELWAEPTGVVGDEVGKAEGGPEDE